ncbi:MAG: OB-fold domain-containing protein [Candidatus Lokiarchaeota archaeon]
MSYNKDEYQIKWKKCKKCGFLQHESHIRCLKCKNKTFKEIRPSGLGRLLTYTILNVPPMEFKDKKSYALGVVEFENGIRALGQLTVKENLKVGIKLKPIFAKICDNLDGKEVKTYIFEPVV